MESAAAASTAAAVLPTTAATVETGPGGTTVAPEGRAGAGSGNDRPRSASVASLVSENDADSGSLASEEAKAEVIAAFPFLGGALDGVEMLFTAEDVAGVDWTDPGAVQKALRPQPKKSTKQIPMSVLQDSAGLSNEAKALLASYWRGLTAADMKDVVSELRQVYAAYTVGNGKVKGGSSSGNKRKRGDLDLNSMEKFDGLAGDHPFVKRHGIVVENVAKVVDEAAVEGRDLTQASTIRDVFKATDFPGCGGKQMPMAIILDCSSDRDRLVMGNWWRTLSKTAQELNWKKLQSFYRAPTNCNDPLLVGTAAAAAALGLPQHVGAASDQETLDKHASVSANFKTAQSQKRRKLSDPATSTAQKFDKAVRRKLGGIQKEVKHINNSTSSDGATNLAGRTSTVLVCETNVATPPKQGYHGMEKAIRAKKKVFVEARSMESVVRHLGPGWVEWKKRDSDVFFSFDLDHQLQLEKEEEERKREGVQAVSKNRKDMETEYEETANITHLGEVDASVI